MAREVPLHGRRAAGRSVLVDDADYALVADHRWWVWENVPARKGPYAVAWLPEERRQVRMHNLLRPQWLMVDHWDGNGLNNQGSNLRDTSYGLNGANRAKQAGQASSQYKGVTWLRRAGLWQAGITVAGRFQYLGRFSDEELAARAYDTAALEAFGEFARVNFP